MSYNLSSNHDAQTREKTKLNVNFSPRPAASYKLFIYWLLNVEFGLLMTFFDKMAKSKHVIDQVKSGVKIVVELSNKNYFVIKFGR